MNTISKYPCTRCQRGPSVTVLRTGMEAMVSLLHKSGKHTIVTCYNHAHQQTSHTGQGAAKVPASYSVSHKCQFAPYLFPGHDSKELQNICCGQILEQPLLQHDPIQRSANELNMISLLHLLVRTLPPPFTSSCCPVHKRLHLQQVSSKKIRRDQPAVSIMLRLFAYIQKPEEMHSMCKSLIGVS